MSNDFFPGPQGNVYYPQQQRKRRKAGWIILGLIALGALLCCIGAITFANDTKPSGNQIDNITPSSAAPVPVVKTPAVAPKQILSFKGNGIKKSQIFSTDDEWSLNYTFDCKSFGSQGNFQLLEYTDKGTPEDILVNELGTKGSDTVPVHANPGKHYLEVNSECSWTVTVAG